MNAEEVSRNGRLVAESRIDGTFSGCNGDTLFPLINGQFWVQSQYLYWYHYAYRPRVEIYNYNGNLFLLKEGESQCIPVRQVTNVIKATIISDFNGWSGNTLFELDNGQIWKQSEYDYDYNYSYRPDAVIYSTSGGYKMIVEGKSVAVKQIK